MNRNICRRNKLNRKEMYSNGDATNCKSVIKNSSNDDSSEGEIEFEGWIEFVTKKDKNSNNKTLEKNKKCNRNNTNNKPNIQNEKILKNKNEKRSASSKGESNKNFANKNEKNSENSYASTNYTYIQPEITSNNNMVHMANNGQPALFLNTHENRESVLNSLNPIYVDPISPIVLKNQQQFPQLYIRQPSTVVVTNEQRPPLVINPPAPNVIFKNQSPQPIYVNSARPNIIIKNDPPIMENPVNMDLTPIQVGNSMENVSARRDFINFPAPMKYKGDSFYHSINSYPKENKNNTGVTIPTNFIPFDNRICEIDGQIFPNAYMLNGNQCSNLYQSQNLISTVNPNNNIIQFQQNPALNEYEANVQIVQSPYAQVISETEHNNNLLNQQVIGNSLMQINPSHTTQTMAQPAIQVMPQTQNLEPFINIQAPLTYESNYPPQVTHTKTANVNPQFIYQNPSTAATIVQEKIPNNHLSNQFRTITNNNALAHTTNVTGFNSSPLQQFNLNKSLMQPSSSTKVQPSCPIIGCTPSNKLVQMPPLRRNAYINPNSNVMHHSPKKVQIIARPMNDRSLRF